MRDLKKNEKPDCISMSPDYLG